LWYAGALTIGVAAGIAGDRWSLGFVAETERQVVQHLDSHLKSLPSHDEQSRTIIKQMRDDELKHATTAMAAGAAYLPQPVKVLMRIMSKVMTTVAYWC